MPNNYRDGSVWNDQLELRCLLIFKQAEAQNFKNGIVTLLCRKLSKETGVDEGTLKAKVGNYKSLAGYTRSTNASKATKYFFELYQSIAANEIEKELVGK